MCRTLRRFPDPSGSFQSATARSRCKSLHSHKTPTPVSSPKTCSKKIPAFLSITSNDGAFYTVQNRKKQSLLE